MKDNRAHCSYARPHGIGCAERQMMGGTHKQYHTKNNEHQETTNPKRMV